MAKLQKNNSLFGSFSSEKEQENPGFIGKEAPMSCALPEDRWNAEHYAANARFVADLAEPLVDLLAPQPGEDILDLGCGDGALTEAIARRGANVLGVDGSLDMVRAAQARDLQALWMDGQHLALDRTFDAVFSNAALHWMPDAVSVLRGVRRVLRPGGRFVGEMGGHGNVASIATALRASLRSRGVPPEAARVWFFPTEDVYAAMLREAGFEVRDIVLMSRPTPLPTGIAGWLRSFAGPFLAKLAVKPDPAEHEAMLREVEELLAPALRGASGEWIADYVRLRFHAVAN
jgi:trans-aconitate methyltransferase